MKVLNLKRCPFLQYALGYIAGNPGCSKADIVGTCPNATRANRYSRIDALICAGMVENRSSSKAKYSLHLKGN